MAAIPVPWLPTDMRKQPARIDRCAAHRKGIDIIICSRVAGKINAAIRKYMRDPTADYSADPCKIPSDIPPPCTIRNHTSNLTINFGKGCFRCTGAGINRYPMPGIGTT